MEANDKKDRIMVAAMAIFAELPYHQVKIDHIAAQAGVGKGTVYEYFTSKEDLFLQMIQRSMQTYFDAMKSSMTQVHGASGRLRAIFCFQIAFIEKHATVAQILAAEPRFLHNECQSLMEKQRQELKAMIIDLLNDGEVNGEFRPVDRDIVSDAILSMLFGLWGQVFFQHGAIRSPETAADKILDFFLHGLSAIQS